MLLNCGAREDSWESIGQQRVQTSQILKEINPEYSLERLMLKMKLQYLLWLPDMKNQLHGKDSDAGKD